MGRWKHSGEYPHMKARYHSVCSYVELEVLKLIAASVFDTSKFVYANVVNIYNSTKLFIFVHFTATRNIDHIGITL